MTKGADGTTRVISQPIGGATKSGQAEPTLAKSTLTPQKDSPQKVQIIRAPDGKMSVRGLLPGQQLIQMADGKLHIVMAGQQGVTGQLVATSPAQKVSEAALPQVETKSIEEVKPAPRALAPAPQQIVVQGNRQIAAQQAPAPVVVVQAGARPAVPPRMQTVLMQGQLIQRPVAPAPSTVAPRMRPASTQQIVVNNPALVQQIAAGKIQLATVNGQQVLIRPTGNNQAQIVAHIGQSPTTGAVSVVSAAQAPTLAPRAAPSPAPTPTPVPPPLPPVVQQQQQQQLTEDELVEKRLLVGQPPGTVIKTVTAQVN